MILLVLVIMMLDLALSKVFNLNLVGFQYSKFPVAIKLKKGDTFIVSLKSNPTTGYDWQSCDQDL